MSEKTWRVRYTNPGRFMANDHLVGGDLRAAVSYAIAFSQASDTRKPFVYFDDHARGHIGEQRGCQAGCF